MKNIIELVLTIAAVAVLVTGCIVAASLDEADFKVMQDANDRWHARQK